MPKYACDIFSSFPWLDTLGEMVNVKDTANHIGNTYEHIGNTYGIQNLVIRSQGKVKIAMEYGWIVFECLW